MAGGQVQRTPVQLRPSFVLHSQSQGDSSLETRERGSQVHRCLGRGPHTPAQASQMAEVPLTLLGNLGDTSQEESPGLGTGQLS